MLRTYKYLLRPSREQLEKLDFLLWKSSSVYNAALEQRITSYQEAGKCNSCYTYAVSIGD